MVTLRMLSRGSMGIFEEIYGLEFRIRNAVFP